MKLCKVKTRMLLAKQQMTVRGMCAAAGISDKTYYNGINKRIRTKSAEKIASVLGVELEEIVIEEDKMDKEKKNQALDEALKAIEEEQEISIIDVKLAAVPGGFAIMANTSKPMEEFLIMKCGESISKDLSKTMSTITQTMFELTHIIAGKMHDHEEMKDSDIKDGTLN